MSATKRDRVVFQYDRPGRLGKRGDLFRTTFIVPGYAWWGVRETYLVMRAAGIDKATAQFHVRAMLQAGSYCKTEDRQRPVLAEVES